MQSTGRVAVVREPSARGQFSGLVRVAYGDGSTYHVAAEGLRAQCGDEDVAFGGTRGQDGQDSEALEGSIHGSPLLPSVADGDWRLIADFFGLEFDVDAAAESDQVSCERPQPSPHGRLTTTRQKIDRRRRRLTILTQQLKPAWSTDRNTDCGTLAG